MSKHERDLEPQQREWGEMMEATALADAAAERARRRDEFAKAALAGLLACSNTSGTHEAFGLEAAKYADATLAALDRMAKPKAVESGRFPSRSEGTLPPIYIDGESDVVWVTPTGGGKMLARRVRMGIEGWVWKAAGDDSVVYGVVDWEPVQPSHATRPEEVE